MTLPPSLDIIRREHSALAALLQSMSMMVADARRRARLPDFRSLRAMLFYVEEFPERLHHVKESSMLFPRLRERTREVDATLARLDREHHGGPAKVRELQHLLTAWELLGESRRSAFEGALRLYVAFYQEHLRLEEQEVLPAAERCLTEDDWRMLDRAFGAHRDALAGAEPEAPYVELFRTIVRITPAPYGLGEAVAR
jgi:hemerythrin-like domain-containing protein